MLFQRARRVLPFLVLIGIRVVVLAADVASAADRPMAGTKDEILYRVGYAEFSPEDSVTAYADRLGGSGQRARFSTSVAGTFEAHPHLPSGALVHSIRFDYCVSAGSEVTLDLLDCNLSNDDCNTVISLTSAGGPPSGCSSTSVPDLSGLAYTMLNGSRELILEAHTPGNDHSGIQGVTLGYKLQVSPAPATATFSDVPTDYLYFRAIEALAASGVTSGCGGGNFCPSQPVTRGELAKFLANALGLHWPN